MDANGYFSAFRIARASLEEESLLRQECEIRIHGEFPDQGQVRNLRIANDRNILEREK